jgi:hypothetical protein
LHGSLTAGNHCQVTQALACGVHDAGVVRYLLRTPPLDGPAVVPLAEVELAALPVVTRPLPTVTGYDQLLTGPVPPGEQV